MFFLFVLQFAKDKCTLQNLQSSEKPEDADLGVYCSFGKTDLLNVLPFTEHLFELRTAVEAFGNKIVVEAVTDNTDAKKKVKTDLHAKVKKVLNESPNLYYLNHWANNAVSPQCYTSTKARCWFLRKLLKPDPRMPRNPSRIPSIGVHLRSCLHVHTRSISRRNTTKLQPL